MNPKPFITKLRDWRKIVKEKHLLFDTDAIINIIHYGTQDFFEQLKEKQVTNCYINPIYIELMKTDKYAKRVKRQVAIDTNSFYELPFTHDVFVNAREIQQYLAFGNCYPSPADLYLSGFLAKYHHGMILLTGNTQDFPAPLFNREGYIIFQDNNHARTLSLLSINPELLTPF